MKSLLELKQALSKIDDKDLDRFYITHAMRACESDPEIRMDILFVGEEEQHMDLMKKFDEPGFETIKTFVNHLNQDVDKIVKASNNEESFERYCEDDDWELAQCYEDDKNDKAE